jgi:hypothetical protein
MTEGVFLGSKVLYTLNQGRKNLATLLVIGGVELNPGPVDSIVQVV